MKILFDKKIMIAAIIGIVFGAFLIYEYPIQRYFALKKFYNYTTTQGVDESNIKKKDVYKDWKNGGYSIIVNYWDNPDYEYAYHYYVVTHKKGEPVIYNRMLLEITDMKTSRVLDPPYDVEIRYLPLD